MSEELYSLEPIGEGSQPCYICNTTEPFLQPRAKGRVHNVVTGETILNMFQSFGLHAEMSYDSTMPSDASISIGACTRHRQNLEKLVELTSKEERINPAVIVKSLAV